MAKFSAVPQPIPATEPATIKLVDGTEVRALVRHLMGEQEGTILAEAVGFAKANGVDKPSTNDPLYLFGMMIATVHLGYVDADAPTEPVFDGGAKQIRGSLDRERIAFLWAKHAEFQDRMSGSAEPMSDLAVLGWIHRIVEADPTDRTIFAELRPLRQFQLLRGMAQYCDLVTKLYAVPRPEPETPPPAEPPEKPQGPLPVLS